MYIQSFENGSWIEQMVNWMKKEWGVKTIGPCIPSAYMDKQMKDDREYGLSIINTTTGGDEGDEFAIMKWLDNKEAGSVVYVSFGSLAEVGADQMKEVAHGLMNCGSPFLWVVRDSEVKKIPSDFVDEIMKSSSNKGVVVGWCNQLEVLAHGAMGCFVSHCGWNSTLEALSSGVPIVALPQWTDQITNAKFVADVWGIGARAKKSGVVVRSEEVVLRIREVIGPDGEAIRKNVAKWKHLAVKAVDEGGTSDTNFDEFVAHLQASLH